MFTNVANTSHGFDIALTVILGMCTALFVLVMGLMTVFVFKYRRSRAPHPRVVKEPLWLEITWTVVPLILVMIMFWYGFVGYRTFKTFSSDDFFEATVIGRMWLWEYEYPNGVTVQNDLYVPVGRPVKLKITSVDVNHSFFIPAFHIKQDAIPGYDYDMKFEADKTGSYDIYCAEYCGLQHAYMLGKLKVLPEEEFNQWMAEQEAALAQSEAESAEGEEAPPAEDTVGDSESTH